MTATTARLSLAVLLLMPLALAACGKKPDFPVPADGRPAQQRFYPDPALDPSPRAPGPAGATDPAKAAKPVDGRDPNPGAPAGSAIPPAGSGANTGR